MCRLQSTKRLEFTGVFDNGQANAQYSIVLSFVKPVEDIKRILDGHATLYTDDVSGLSQILPEVSVAFCYGKLNHVKEMRNLRMIQVAAAGVDGLPWEDIPERVIVCGNPGSNAEAVAEHTWALILGQAHNLQIHLPNLKKGTFDSSPGGSILTGKTIGIIGMGSVGRRIGEIARAFRMRVMGITKTGRSSSTCDFIGGPEDMDQVLRESDVVVLSMPLTTSTRGIIDSRRLAQLKSSCILVNMGRAQLVNREDLLEFLGRNREFRVATDVWWNPDDYREDATLMGYKNFVGTPYVAGGLGNPEVMRKMLTEAALNVRRFLLGEKPPTS